MRRFVQIDENIVTGVLFATEAPAVLPEGRIFVEPKDEAVAEHWRYDARTNTFTAPPPPPYGATVSQREFLWLFTAAQRKAIRSAAQTDADVSDWAATWHVPEPIRLMHPRTLAGLTLLVDKALLTSEERARISNNIASSNSTRDEHRTVIGA